MKKRKLTIILFSVFFVLITFLHSSLVFAQGVPGDSAGTGPGSTSKSKTEIRMIDNPLGDSEEARDPRKLLGRIIGAVLGIIGSLALAIFVFGGFTWMTAAGNEDKIKKGRDMIVWAVFGLAVIFLSYVLVEFILGAFVGT